MGLLPGDRQAAEKSHLKGAVMQTRISTPVLRAHPPNDAHNSKRKRPKRLHRHKRRGNVIVLSAVMMVALMTFLALSLDSGYMYYEQARCQNAADAASHAAAVELLEDREALAAAKQAAISYATSNMPDGGDVLTESDVTYGVWDDETRLFTASNESPNAIMTTVRRSHANSNAVRLFFAPIIGHTHVELSASAVTKIPDNGPQFKFLLDEETIDSDEQAIEDLASQYGVPPEDLITDNDGDGWIDLPPDTTLELPTGQQGDEGLFDVSSYEGAFPFTSSSPFNMVDFLAEGTALQDELLSQQLQDLEWTQNDAPHPDLTGMKVLDPVPGVDPVSSHQTILDLPGDATYVSPVFKSDVSMQETDVSVYGSPAANLQGERRGLLAYKIESARAHPDGGSYLPLITILVVDPETLELSEVSEAGGTSSGSGDTVLRPTIVK